MKTRLFFTHALSPLHPGTGQGIGAIDLPIAREKATGLPYLPGSSLKGTLRTACPDADRTAVFGPPTTEGELHAGAIQFGDQRLLLLPIRSLAGTFAWVSSPYVLRRFARDMLDSGLQPPAAVPAIAQENACYVANECALRVKDNAVYLEDLDLTAQDSADVRHWAEWIAGQIFADADDWQTFLRQRFCLVHDDVLSFLLNTATEVVARIRLEETSKTVSQGGLWYEEALPSETILAGIALARPNGKNGIDADTVFQVIDACIEQPLQLGGKATVGRGLCRLRAAQEVHHANA
jgi:CRISPR-associated protein Cmr4